MEKKRRTPLFKNISGQGLVEFALVLPILLLIVFGIIDFGRLFYQKTVLDSAAREGIRMASVGTDLSVITENIKSLISPLTGNTTSTISTGTDENGANCTKIMLTPASGEPATIYITPAYKTGVSSGCTIRISISYRMEYITPTGKLFGSLANLKSVYYTRYEAP